MITHELTFWPLVVSVSSGAPTYDDLLEFNKAWSGWLDRGSPFAVMRILADTQSHTQPPGGAKEKKGWLQKNGERIRSRVIGMATVVPAEIFADVSKMDAQKLFGVPARSFVSVEDALAWLTPLLDAESMRLDRNAISNLFSASADT